LISKEFPPILRCVERSTRQKRAIEAVLEKHKNPLTAPEILKLALEEVPTLGLATVYRSLKALARDGRVVSVEIPGQMPRYERSDKGHHHHFACRLCGGVFELERCLAGIKTMAPPRFRVEDHDIILYGTCEACLSKQSSSNARKTKNAAPGFQRKSAIPNR
jgi:Fur family transcriptional regulator, ferric uptake regulator